MLRDLAVAHSSCSDHVGYIPYVQYNLGRFRWFFSVPRSNDESVGVFSFVIISRKFRWLRGLCRCVLPDTALSGNQLDVFITVRIQRRAIDTIREREPDRDFNNMQTNFERLWSKFVEKKRLEERRQRESEILTFL